MVNFFSIKNNFVSTKKTFVNIRNLFWYYEKHVTIKTQTCCY